VLLKAKEDRSLSHSPVELIVNPQNNTPKKQDQGIMNNARSNCEMMLVIVSL